MSTPPAAAAGAAADLEARTLDIARELRCLVCQNESIADSRADLARDLRGKVRTMLSEGRSREEILGFMTARYGDFVRYQPPLKSSTLLLWGAPAIFAVGGGLLLAWTLRRRQRMAPEAFDDSSGFAEDVAPERPPQTTAEERA